MYSTGQRKVNVAHIIGVFVPQNLHWGNNKSVSSVFVDDDMFATLTLLKNLCQDTELELPKPAADGVLYFHKRTCKVNILFVEFTCVYLVCRVCCCL